MEIKKNKELYDAPSTRVIELQQRTQLLTGSGQAGVQDYTNHDYYEE